MFVLKVKVISLPYIFQVLYVLWFTRPRYQVSVYRTIGPLVYSNQIRILVAMATYSFQCLIMGKAEIGDFCCVIRNIWNLCDFLGPYIYSRFTSAYRTIGPLVSNLD